MRFFPHILMLVGILGVVGALSCIEVAGSAVTMISGLAIGIAFISLSVAVWQRRKSALRLGYLVILLGFASFIAGPLQLSLSLEPWEKLAVIGGSVIGGALVAFYWTVVWRRFWMKSTYVPPEAEQDVLPNK